MVWGNEKFGLKKIYEKHLEGFRNFGVSERGLIDGLDEIIRKGKLISKNKVHTIIYKKR